MKSFTEAKSFEGGLDMHSSRMRRTLILLSPFAVILLGQLAVRTFGTALGAWSWFPLNIGYWVAILLLVAWGGGREAMKRWLQPARGGWIWPFFAICLAVIPTLPMQFPDTWRLMLQTRIWLPTLIFVIVNPFAEEGYWRGLLIDAMAGRSKWQAVLYSSTLFMLNHMWMSVIVIGARNPMGSIFQFIFGVLMAVTYLKTNSLRWPLAAHVLANLLTPTIAVFLNLYIPAGP